MERGTIEDGRRYFRNSGITSIALGVVSLILGYVGVLYSPVTARLEIVNFSYGLIVAGIILILIGVMCMFTAMPKRSVQPRYRAMQGRINGR